MSKLLYIDALDTIRKSRAWPRPPKQPPHGREHSAGGVPNSLRVEIFCGEILGRTLSAKDSRDLAAALDGETRAMPSRTSGAIRPTPAARLVRSAPGYALWPGAIRTTGPTRPAGLSGFFRWAKTVFSLEKVRNSFTAAVVFALASVALLVVGQPVKAVTVSHDSGIAMSKPIASWAAVVDGSLTDNRSESIWPPHVLVVNKR